MGEVGTHKGRPYGRVDGLGGLGWVGVMGCGAGVLEEGVQNCDETVSKSMGEGSDQVVLHFGEHSVYAISLICQREGIEF